MSQPSKCKQGGSMTKPVDPRRMLRSRAGTTTLEFALVMLPFLMMIFGIVDFSRLIWTQSALQFATERAARCAAVNTSACGTLSEIQAYAGSQAFATEIPTTAFSYAANACGSDVSATTSFTFISTILMPTALTLTARSCYPT